MWRGIGRELGNDAACGRPPAVVSAAVFGVELARTLSAHLTDRYHSGAEQTNAKTQFATPTGATIDVDFDEARVVVAGADYRCDVTMLPDRIAVDDTGNFGPEAITGLYLLDWLHEQGELPTDQDRLSGGHLVLLSELRDSLVDDEAEPEVLAD